MKRLARVLLVVSLVTWLAWGVASTMTRVELPEVPAVAAWPPPSEGEIRFAAAEVRSLPLWPEPVALAEGCARYELPHPGAAAKECASLPRVIVAPCDDFVVAFEGLLTNPIQRFWAEGGETAIRGVQELQADRAGSWVSMFPAWSDRYGCWVWELNESCGMWTLGTE